MVPRKTATEVDESRLGNSDALCAAQMRRSYRLVNIFCQKTNFNSGITLPVVGAARLANCKSLRALYPRYGLGRLLSKPGDQGQR